MIGYDFFLEGETIEDMLALARRVEDAGFSTLWSWELYRTAFIPLAAIATHTKSLRLGTSIALAFTRSPLITALSALDLADISQGRFVLGLGTGVRRLNELWHGVSYGKPASHLKECVEVTRLIMRTAHTGQPIRYRGEYYNIDIRGYRRPYLPRPEGVPIFMAGIQERMVQVAGQVADGWLGHTICNLAWIQDIILPNIRKGLEQSGRERNDFSLTPSFCCAISNDVKEARRAAAATVAFYATVRTYDPIFARHGFEREAFKIKRAFVKGDTPRMVNSVSDDMVEAFTAAGPPDTVRGKVAQYEGIADSVILTAPHYYIPPEQVRSYQDAILEVFGK